MSLISRIAVGMGMWEYSLPEATARRLIVRDERLQPAAMMNLRLMQEFRDPAFIFARPEERRDKLLLVFQGLGAPVKFYDLLASEGFHSTNVAVLTWGEASK
jgi:hypothetical protein